MGINDGTVVDAGTGEATPENQPAVPATPAAPRVEDFADRELREATEALAKAEAEKAKPAAAATPSNDLAGKEVVPKGFAPVAAVVSERAGRQKAEQDAAYWKGVAEGATHVAKATAAPAATPAAPKVTPAQRLDQIRQARFDLARKYDDGEIKTVDWETNRVALEDEERQIREQTRAPAQAAAPATDLLLETQTHSLEQQYPVLTKVTAEDLQPLVAIAYKEAAAEGKPIQKGTAAGTLALRTKVAQIATRVYAPGTATPPAQTPNQSGPSGKPAVPAHPASSKADLAASHPIDAASLGSAATAGEISDADLQAQLESMNEEERANFISAQPALVQRVMGRVASR